MPHKNLQYRNHFGKLTEDYAKYRRGYPDEVYQEIRKRLPEAPIQALDVGCGTGLASYALSKFCQRVIGADKEKEIIAEAQKHAPNNCDFIVSPAEQLPFEDASFDLITVAQAFHWFDREKTLTEFHRLLQKNGLVAIFRKQGPDGFRIVENFVWPVLSTYTNITKSNRKQDDFSFLHEENFHTSEMLHIPYEELYTPDEYLGFLRSHSTYTLVPEEKRNEYMDRIREAMEPHLKNGLLSIQGVVEIWFLKK